MNSDVDIGRLALSIMEHPDLIEKIKNLAEGSGESEKKDTDAHDEGKGELRTKNSKKRSALLCSLKPYLNEKRRGAIDTMITVLDVIDAVIYK